MVFCCGLWAEKNFSCLGSRRVDSRPHGNSTHTDRSGMQISQRRGGVGEPQESDLTES